MKQALLILLVIGFVASLDFINEVGYRVGKVQGYKELKRYAKSVLYEIISPELDDGRPIKLIDLHGTSYEVGFDYGYLLAEELYNTYQLFFKGQITNPTELFLMETFLDYQYDSFVKKQLPLDFIDELKGIEAGGKKKGFKRLRTYCERVLVVSSFPGALQNDMEAVIIDEFLRFLRIKNPQVQSMIENKIHYMQTLIAKFFEKKSVLCSFFGVWGKRTNNNLYTMRNLDWEPNTGINQNKLITVYHITGKIAHLTLGYPGVIGALTGMSAAGITVHQTGLSNIHESQIGFQWTLRMRYVMMNARNLKEALSIWKQTNNTLGMTFMFGSAADGKAIAMQTMRAYTAIFQDGDSRQNGTIFTDHKGNTYRSGYSMKQAVFRTNHAYDSKINNGRPDRKMDKGDDSMIRYFILKDSFQQLEKTNTIIGREQALNITAVLGDKGTQKFLSCKGNSNGLNVISVLYEPKSLMMWAAFEYGYQKTFRSACCGVYIQIDMNRWFSKQQTSLTQEE